MAPQNMLISFVDPLQREEFENALQAAGIQACRRQDLNHDEADFGWTPEITIAIDATPIALAIIAIFLGKQRPSTRGWTLRKRDTKGNEVSLDVDTSSPHESSAFLAELLLEFGEQAAEADELIVSGQKIIEDAK